MPQHVANGAVAAGAYHHRQHLIIRILIIPKLYKVSQSTIQSINQSTNQPTNQSNNQSINQSIDQPINVSNVLGGNWDPTDKKFSSMNSYRQDLLHTCS